ALGQPVKVGSIGATIYPRVTVNLGQVSIGEPARIQVQALHVGADFGALLSRHIEHARLELTGARVELPLPAFSIGSGSTSGPSSKPPVDIVSIDAIALRGVEIVSGGRTLTGDVVVVPDGKGLTLQKVTFRADRARIDVTGRIVDLSGPVGDVAIKAGTLNFDQLLAFANDFATGTVMRTSTGASSARTRPTNPEAGPTGVLPMNIAVSVEADRATMGLLTLDKLEGKARITADAMTFETIGFGVFGGRYDGSLVFTLGAVPDFKLNARLTGVDMAVATAFAGNPGTISGRLSGTLNLTGRGMDASSVMKAAHGAARVNIVNGAVKNLGLVRSIVVATSGRADAAGAGGGTRDEPFTKLGATLTVAGGSASTEDLRFESKDLLLAAAGIVRLDGSAVNLTGQVQLSDELSKQAGRDLVRYTQEGGRVTLPATITGSADAPHVTIDVASMAKRALTNRANEEAQKALKKGLSGLFKK
ncbi:MAG TPA: AsmA-like C-terminal region-containing protein, partial [Vicinamibacterales bacterium]|nr:AsmA-like C-terminal region-containing protein [Vicinamibacterales bacterium]